jgi:putative Holliday junction resolvase
MRSLGLDIGERRIGVALSDPLGVNATPLEVLEDIDPADLRAYVEEEVRQGVEVVVVGLPLTCRGEEGGQARSTREYARVIEGIEGIEVVLWDERFSTVEAERRLKEAGRSLRGRRVDAEAAAVILQSYLEYAGGGGKAEEENNKEHG